jgi:hypothetical protein
MIIAGSRQLIGFLCAGLEFPGIILTINAQFVMVFAMKMGANFRIDERDKIEIRETDNRNRLGIA